MKKRTKALIGTAVAAVMLGVGGFAFAAFVQTKSAEAGSKAAKFAPMTVTGTVAEQNMLPGEKSNVTLALENPASNTVKAKVETITAAGVTVAPASVGGDAALATACAGYITQDPANANNGAKPTLSIGGTANYVLQDGITFGDAPIDCQGMEFTTTWTVTFSPVK